MADTTTPAKTLTPAETVTAFLEALQAGDSKAALALLDPEVEWRNTGLPTLRGRRATGAIVAMEKRGIGFAVAVHQIAADGPVVLTDRTDVIAYGPVSTAFWVCGTFEVRDGVIVLWDDHFSMAGFVGGVRLGRKPRV